MFSVKYSFVGSGGERVHSWTRMGRAELDNLIDMVALRDEMAYRIESVR